MPKKPCKATEALHLDNVPSTSIANAKRRHSKTEQNMTTANRNRGKTENDSSARNELKGLQDSLTKFFTPNDIRRSRTANKTTLDQPLEIAIDNNNYPKGISSASSKTSNFESHNVSPKSPHRHDKLEDALSPYFTPNPCKRRLHKEGEYWQLSRGDGTKTETTSPDQTAQNEEKFEIDHTGSQVTTLAQRHSRTQKSNQHAERNADSEKSITAQKRLLRKKESVGTMKMAQLLKRAYKGTRDIRKHKTKPVSDLKISDASSLKNSMKNFHRSLKPIIAKEINIPQDISEKDRALFEKAREAVQKDLDSANNALKQNENAIFPPKIRIHCYEIDTWYSAPYPQEYACLPVLHICNTCLMYLSVPSSHYRKCKQQFPPGNEIYRGINFSIFEVDGNLARVYCRNLCLLAKLFIDHKTLYFDVEPFLFYVLTLNDETGCHFVGYFSKEKYSSQKYNLACIVTLPCYQGQGFGRLLIDFSYLLSRREGLVGTPEKPLSDLGKIAYHSYWLSSVFEYFHNRLQTDKKPVGQIALNEISIATGIASHDVAEILAENLLLQTKDKKTSIVLDENAIFAHWEKAKRNPKRIWLDESRLQWTPKLYSPSKEFRIHSPAFSKTPLPSINSPDPGKEIGEPDEQVVQPKKRKSVSRACRKLQVVAMKGRAPSRISVGKIGRKRLPGKNVKEHQESQSSVSEESEKEASKKSSGRKNQARCNETTEKLRKKRGNSSTDDDDDHYTNPKLISHMSKSFATTSSAPSISNTASRSLRKTSSNGKCTVSKSNELFDTHSYLGNVGEEKSIKFINRTGRKHPTNEVKKGHLKNMREDEPETDDSSTVLSPEIRKRKILRKKRPTKRPNRSSHTESSFDRDSDQKGTAEAKQRRKAFQRHESSSDEEGEDEERSCCSSASPQPIGDRLPIFKISLKEHENLINMGGEPDTVNMGGEPEDDGLDNSGSFSTIGVSSYKAPVLICSNALEAEDELEEPPAVEHPQKKIESWQPVDMQKDNANSIRMTASQVANMNLTCQHSLNIPPMQGRKSHSPDVTTVEMPALDAAEKHISPVESQFRFEEEESVDDDAPPMLSPQQGNLSTNEPVPAAESELSITPVELASKTNESPHLEEQHNISASSIVTHEKSHDDESQPLPHAEQPESSEIIARGQSPSTDLQGDLISKLLPQIRVRSESNVEFCTQLPINRVQRTCSFSGNAVTNDANELTTQSIQPSSVVLSVPAANVAPNASQQEKATQQQQSHYANSLQLQQNTAISPFTGTGYNQSTFGMAQPQPLIQQTKSKSEKSKKAKPKATPTSSSEKNKSPQKQQSSIVQNAVVSSAFASVPSTSMAMASSFNNPWASMAAAQFYQYPYAAGNRQGCDFSAMSAQQMNNYAPYLYNQAAWQAWQMSAAAKFPSQAAPASASAYPNAYDFFHLNMVNGAAAAGGNSGLVASSSAGSVWPTGFNQIRPNTPVTTPQVGFYQHPHPPL